MHSSDLALALQQHGYTVKKQGAEWRAQCPAHGGADLNLAFSDGEEAVVCTCHSHHCPTEKVAGALGIAVGDLRFKPRGAPNGSHHEPTIFPYHDAAGKVIYEVRRTDDKKFSMWLPGHTHAGIGPSPRILFGIPQLLKSESGGLIAITEGEKCAMAVAALGIPATTNPNGAGRWRPEYTAWLLENVGDRKFLVLPDNDTEGKKHAVEVCEALRAAGLPVWLADLGELPPKGDVVQWIGRGGTADQLRAMAADKPHPLDLLVMEGDRIDAADLSVPDALIPHLLYRGFSTLIAGDSKLGKSSLLLRGLLASACGGWWLDKERRPENQLEESRILFLNFEDPLFVTRFRARKMMAPEGLPKNFLSMPPPYGYTLSQVLDWIHGAYQKLRLDAVVLDPIAIAAEWTDETDNAEVARTFKQIQKLAAETNLAMLSAHHVTKKPGQYGLNIRGASAIKANVLGYLVLEREKELFKLSGINKLAGEWDVTLDRTERDWSWWIVESRSGNTRTAAAGLKEEAMRDLLNLLRETPMQTTEALAEMLGLKTRTCLNYLNELRSEKKIVSQPLPVGEKGGRPESAWIALSLGIE